MAKIIVVGLGAMGSAAAQHLAERGHQAIAFDRFTPPHTKGSSHGQTRMIRQAYWEDSRYVPLVLRAYELWRRLERDSGRRLLHVTGGLVIGRPQGTLALRSKESAEAFHLPYQMLTATDVRSRFPAFSVPDDAIALWEEQAGYLVPEDCVRHNSSARKAQALRFNSMSQFSAGARMAMASQCALPLESTMRIASS
jgi:sarcosine oxidase